MYRLSAYLPKEGILSCTKGSGLDGDIIGDYNDLTTLGVLGGEEGHLYM